MKVNIHTRAEKCRLKAQCACDDYNYKAGAAAIEEFEKGEVGEYFRENAAFITGLVIERLNAVKEGKPTFPIRGFDAETIVRLMSSDTEADYEVMCYNADLSDEDTIAAAETDNLTQCGFDTTIKTPSTALQNKLRSALLEYARSAAAYAKKIGSASILDWAGIIDILENLRISYTSRLREEDVVRLVALEKSAADRLRLDKIIMELPTFKVSGKSRKAR